ncbi:START domain-containing protein [Halioxenophilus sp. WMMB6]|uniref:START domain-containing protein n=1 Tax=Halioxenophilus sp. WMMB6 TaxID=3073815 RepID=UPI00295EA70B|nr:START domain-containing protein [Halioxenophilus sp. WMMB6]
MAKPHLTHTPTLLLVLLTLLASGCTSLRTTEPSPANEWQLTKQQAGIDFYTRPSELGPLPEFKASTVLKVPKGEVMNLLLDFERHPQWVYGCQESEMIAMESYTEAYIYQVTKMPVIKGRDLIMLATTTEDYANGQTIIELQAAPDYCANNSDRDCTAIRAANYVHVQHARGRFIVTELSEQSTQIDWIQYVDPAGLVPHWLVRANLARVPIKSLRQLKALLESEKAGAK